MSLLKEILVEQLQDLLHAENQLTKALPQMAQAATHPKLKEAFSRHLSETQGQIERLEAVFDLLGEASSPRPCKGMTGLIAEGEEVIQQSSDKEPIPADLTLIGAAQKIEHYEIAAYGTARGLARQIGQMEAARLLSHSLGEEERADFLLTAISDPLIQQASLDDLGADVHLEGEEKRAPAKRKAAKR